MSVNIIMQFEVKQKLVLLQVGDKFVFYIKHKSILGFSKQSQKFFIQTTKNFGSIVCRVPIVFFSVTRAKLSGNRRNYRPLF